MDKRAVSVEVLKIMLIIDVIYDLMQKYNILI